MQKLLLVIVTGSILISGCTSGSPDKANAQRHKGQFRSLDTLKGCRITLEKEVGGRLNVQVNGTSAHSMTEHCLEDMGSAFLAGDHEVFELADYNNGGFGNAVMPISCSAEILNPSIKYVEVKGSDQTATLAVPENPGTVQWP